MQYTNDWNFDNTYLNLPSSFYSKVLPTKVSAPSTVLFNDELATQIGVEYKSSQHEEIAQIFSGNKLLTNSIPIAQAYAGHQFGGFTMLGDGRAILVGEHITPQKQRIDIQLKGSGETPYSRRGDGRATLKSMLREYLISEAMHGLNIPTSRSLAVVASGENVYRESIHQGAVLTRIAASHLRVGTFEYARHFLPIQEQESLLNYAIKRHYPEILNHENKALSFLNVVLEKQINLVVNWLRVGFIHGVMNTDNMSIAGETIDYGPCAFMNTYDPKTVFSSIDTNGRYAYFNQPGIAQWNLMCLANALLPLIDQDINIAISKAQEVIDGFSDKFQTKWNVMMAAKLGFPERFLDSQIVQLIADLLQWMQDNKSDFTNTYLAIHGKVNIVDSQFTSDSFREIQLRRSKLLNEFQISTHEMDELMIVNNPTFIPRNHLVEEALENASNHGDYSKFNKLLNATKNPYATDVNWNFEQASADFDNTYKTFCGT